MALSNYSEQSSGRFSINDVKPDDYSDKIGRLIKEYGDSTLSKMQKERREIMNRIETECDKQGYIIFGGDIVRFLIGRVGDSYIYDVPYNKTGHLAEYRKQTIRVICVGSGRHFNRSYRAGILKYK